MPSGSKGLIANSYKAFGNKTHVGALQTRNWRDYVAG